MGCGSPQQSLTTLWLKTAWRIPSLACFLVIFWSWPLVLESVFISKKMLDSTLSMPFIMLNTCSISHLLLLYSSDGNPSTVNRSSYGSCFMLGISLVARLGLFSTSTLSRRNLGCQIKFPYSRCGRTMVVNNLGTVVSSRHVKVALTSPSIRDALLTAFAMWWWNFKSLSINKPVIFDRCCLEGSCTNLVIQPLVWTP